MTLAAENQFNYYIKYRIVLFTKIILKKDGY